MKRFAFAVTESEQSFDWDQLLYCYTVSYNNRRALTLWIELKTIK